MHPRPYDHDHKNCEESCRHLSFDEELKKRSIMQIKWGFVPKTKTTGEAMNHALINQPQSN